MFRPLCFCLLLIVTPSFVSAQGAKRPTKIVAHLFTKPEVLNPLYTSAQSEVEISEYIFEALYALDHDKLEYSAPLLAAGPMREIDSLTYEIPLRKNIRWPDGEPFTGHDVLFSLKAIRAPVGLGWSAHYAHSSFSAKLVNNDPYLIRISIGESDHLLRKELRGPTFPIIPKHIYDPWSLSDSLSWGELQDTLTNIDALDFVRYMRSLLGSRNLKYYQGTGPYKLKSWTDDIISLEANTTNVRCTGGKKCPLPLTFRAIGDYNAAYTAIKFGDLNAVPQISNTLFHRLDTAAFRHISKEVFPRPSITLLGWNHQSPLFKDRRVRQALGHLIDRDSIISLIYRGLAIPTQSVVFFLRPEYHSLPMIAYNKQEAVALLKEAGWEDRDGDSTLDAMIDGKKVDFSFTFLTNKFNKDREYTLQMIVDSLKTVGIRARIEKLDWETYIGRAQSHDFEARIGSWQLGATDPDTYSLYHSSQSNGGDNYNSWNNRKADSLLERIRDEGDRTKRIALWKEFQEVFYEDQPETLLWMPLTPVLWDNRFKNVKFYPATSAFNYAEWELDD